MSAYSDVPASAPSPACSAPAAAAAGTCSVSGPGLRWLHAPSAELSVCYDGNGEPVECSAAAPAEDTTAAHPT